MNIVMNRTSLHQLEYKMERADLSDDFNFFETEYCGHPEFPYTHTQLEQATKLILSNFQEE